MVPDINQFTSKGAEFVDGEHEEFDSIILATGYKSNVTSWLKVRETIQQHVSRQIYARLE